MDHKKEKNEFSPSINEIPHFFFYFKISKTKKKKNSFINFLSFLMELRSENRKAGNFPNNGRTATINRKKIVPSFFSNQSIMFLQLNIALQINSVWHQKVVICYRTRWQKIFAPYEVCPRVDPFDVDQIMTHFLFLVLIQKRLFCSKINWFYYFLSINIFFLAVFFFKKKTILFIFF